MNRPNLSQIKSALRQVTDPETGKDLLAMGMIYDIRIEGQDIFILMTTTTRGCPLTEMLRIGVESALQGVEGVGRAQADMTWDPPWSPDRMEQTAF